MALPRKGPATYADIEALPPNVVSEILFGVLHSHPRPSPQHAAATTELVGELRNPFGRGSGGPGGWAILVEPELHLVGQVVVPDMAGWRRERLPRLPETAFIETAPDRVSEVLSPSTARLDSTGKLAVYAEHAVAPAWYVDPGARTLEVLAITGGKWMIAATFKDADPVPAPPFEAPTFALDVLWPADLA